MVEVRFGYGDSRNPDEIKLHKNIMHTNSLVPWMYFEDRWYNITSSYWYMKLKNILESCKTEEEQFLWFDMAREEHIIE